MVTDLQDRPRDRIFPSSATDEELLFVAIVFIYCWYCFGVVLYVGPGHGRDIGKISPFITAGT